MSEILLLVGRRAVCEGGHPEPSGQGPSSVTRGERGEDLSEFDSPGQIRVPPGTRPEPFAAAEKSVERTALKT